ESPIGHEVTKTRRGFSTEKLRAFVPSCLRGVLCVALCIVAPAIAQAQKRLVLIDQDGAGPADSNQMAMMALLQSPQTDVLGITIVTGDGWRDEEVLHTLRMLELIGK